MNEEEKNHHDTMIQGFNMILEETDLLKRKMSWANEHIDYVNSNTRHIFVKIEQMSEQMQSITRTLSSIKNELESIKRT